MSKKNITMAVGILVLASILMFVACKNQEITPDQTDTAQSVVNRITTATQAQTDTLVAQLNRQQQDLLEKFDNLALAAPTAQAVTAEITATATATATLAPTSTPIITPTKAINLKPTVEALAKQVTAIEQELNIRVGALETNFDSQAVKIEDIDNRQTMMEDWAKKMQDRYQGFSKTYLAKPTPTPGMNIRGRR